ncbi:MAG: 6-bladed beta-propeller [Gemmatimonadota bacterium]
MADNLYVLDGAGTGKPRIIAFDARGRFVRQFGRRGGGPGEFQTPREVFVSGNGEIVVSDAGNSAFVVFGPNGDHRRNIRFTTSFRPGQNAPRTQGALSDRRGGVVALTSRATTDSGMFITVFRQALEGESAPTPLHRFRIDPLRRFAIPARDNMPSSMVMRTPMYEADPMIGVLPDGSIVLFNHHEYALKVLDENGRHVRTIAGPIPAKKTTKQDRDDYHIRQADDWERRNPRQPAPRLPYELPFAEYISVLTAIFTEPNRIWVQRRNSDGADRGPIDLLAVGGRYIGTLPAQPLPVAVSANGRAAYLVTDDL